MQKSELKIFLANSDSGEIKFYSECSSWINVKKGDKLVYYEDYQKLEQEKDKLQDKVYHSTRLVEELKQNLERAKKALEFYADIGSWSHTGLDKSKVEYTNLENDKDLGNGDFWCNEDVNDKDVSGLRAREALRELE